MTQQRRSLILTGASRGIGHAAVKRFSDEGWQIITCSRDPVPEHCKRDPNWTTHIPMDLADPADVERFIGEACAILGDQPLNALVNNAALLRDGSLHSPSPQTPLPVGEGLPSIS